jgi:serine/threonine protein kinase/predicted Zn-dependent protease
MLDEILFKKYRLEGELSGIRTALAYHGVEVASGRRVIVTVLKTELVPAKEFLARFEKVARKLKELDIPNAVLVLDYGEYQNQAVVVQECVDGRALSDMLAESAGLQVNLVLDIAKQIGKVLGVLHQAGVVHGGLDLTSIILAADGNIKVMNTGLAYAAQVAELIVAHKLDAQTFDAPELRAGGELTPRSDFYALGAILFQALTGEILELDLKVPYSRSQHIGLLPELDELVAKCLQADPARRVQSSAEFLNGIEEARRGLETATQTPNLGVEDALVGHTLGSYQLVERLGHGGMATVYKAYEPALDRYVAIKVLRKFFAQDPEFMQRFRREAKAIAKLDHPNIVPIHGYGEQGDIAYIVMRYVEGGTLKQACGQVFEPERAVRLALPIVKALAYAHQRGIVHRDIKPSNVLLSEGDWPMLADYGLAKMVEATSKLTGSGVGMGTPMYMSPEQGQALEVDHRTDIYSVGIMLYEMLTGDVPFHADTPMAIVIQHISSPMPMPRQVNPDIPEVLERIILKATAKSPDDRFQTAEELVAALEGSLSVLQGITKAEPDGGETRVHPPAPDEDAEKRLERNYIDGLSAYWIKDWARAQAYFQVVVDAQPDYKDVAELLAEVESKLKLGELYQQAQAAMQAEDWQSARAALGELISEDSGYKNAAELLEKANAHLRLTELYAQAGQLSQAGKWQAVVGVFEHIQALEPGYDPDGLLPVAQRALAEGARETELDDLYRQALEAMKAGRWEVARKSLEQVQEGQPGYRDTEQLLGRIDTEMAEMAKGETLPERERLPWHRKVPGWGWVLGGLIVMAMLVGVIGGSVGLFRRVGTLIAAPTSLAVQEHSVEAPTTGPTDLAGQESQDLAYWRENGWSQFQQGDYAAAKGAFDKALELSPEDWSAWWGRAKAYRELGDTQAAIQNFDQAIELNPDGGGIYIDRGWLYFEVVEDYDMAFSDFSRAIEVQPDEPNFRFQRGHAYRLLGMDEEARTDFEMYLEMTGGNPSAEWHAEITQWLEEHQRTVPGCVEPPPGLVSWWTGDGHAQDVIGGNRATLMNGAGFAEGIVEQAFAFPPPRLDHEDATVDIPEAPGLDELQELTIEAWVMLASGPAFRIERFVTLANQNNEYPKACLRIDGGPGFRGELHFFMGIDDELQHIWVADVPEAGDFHHVAGSYDGRVMRLYLDGRQVGALEVTGEVARGASFVFFSSPDEPLDGLLDEVSIYNRALEAPEIQAIFEAGRAGKCKP